MLLDVLIENLKNYYPSLEWYPSKIPTQKIKTITLDSRKTEPEVLFIALKGTHANGEDFIPNALQRGAKVIATSLDAAKKNASLYPDIFFIGAQDMRPFISTISKIFYPQQPETIVAVTGTNGKTSTADFTRYLWEQCGEKSASLGTLGVRSKFYEEAKHLTTPEAPHLHPLLVELDRHHITHVAMEASSHGIDQHRLDSVTLKAAGFTNLSPEHLDYHKTMVEYLSAKAQLFQRILPETAPCVLNADIPEFETLKEKSRPRPIISYGYKGEEIRILSLTPQTQGQKVSLSVLGEPVEFHFPLIGSFQLYNALCALGLVLACNPNHLTKALEGLQTLPPVPGRIEHIASTPNGASIYIDYAHTPDGVENLLKALRPHTKNHLHILFGGGGNRDPSTRKPRGILAATLADYVYISDDNPRFEDPASIRKKIMEGCPHAREIPDRVEAINIAIRALAPGDILVVAGKGRESGQEVRGTSLPFDDAETIFKATQEIS